MSKDKRLTKTAKKAVVVEPDKDQLDSTISLAIALIHRKLSTMADLNPEELDESGLYKLSNALSGLARSQTEVKKHDVLARESFEQARIEFRQRMKLELESYPELSERLRQIADDLNRT